MAGFFVARLSNLTRRECREVNAWCVRQSSGQGQPKFIKNWPLALIPIALEAINFILIRHETEPD
jgi:hypothetical protein